MRSGSQLLWPFLQNSGAYEAIATTSPLASIRPMTAASAKPLISRVSQEPYSPR